MSLTSTDRPARFRHNYLTALACALTLLVPCASAATYYVGTTGSDSNAGTQSAPFAISPKGLPSPERAIPSL